MRMLRAILLLMLCVIPLAAAASAITDAEIPAPLKPWVPWVLHGNEAQRCPLLFDSEDARLCSWPSRLELDLKNSGGSFSYTATQFAPGWLALPGDETHWPQDARVDGAAAPVTLHDDAPMIWLAGGEHRISGNWAWAQLPETLSVPAATALITLSVNGQARIAPGRDERGQLWLGKAQNTQAAGDNHVALKVYRLVDDNIPLRLITHIDLEVAGAVRDEVIGPVLPPDFIALTLSGGLPARLGDDRRLHVQLRPGVWSIELTGRAPGPVSKLELGQPGEGWPAEEIWSLATHNELRTVDPSGPPALDPRQTQMPQEWRGYAAFQMKSGSTLQLVEKQRGNARAEPDQVRLNRSLWLDFDGGGYTLKDTLSGRINRSWRLNAASPIALGRVQIDGQPQLITAQPGVEGAGVEVRHGSLNLSADSRVNESLRRLPASGWDLELQGVDTVLHLPPGWRLLAAPGADNVPQTWVSRWTLLDLFVVLIATVAALRLFGPRVGALALVTLALIWHEPAAPRWTWLNLIAVIAVLKALPDAARGETLLRWLHRYRWISAVVLALWVIPFAVQQARWALYPQLEMHAGREVREFGNASGVMAQKAEIEEGFADGSGQVSNDAVPAAAPMAPPAEAMKEDRARLRAKMEPPKPMLSLTAAAAGSANVSQQSLQQLAPNVLTQTGPGLPDWSWNEARLSWSGPVTGDQSYRLWLLPPWITRLLRVLSLALVALLLMRVMELRRGALPRMGSGSAASLLATVLALTLAAAPRGARADEMPPAPSAQILEELKSRLLAAPDCAGECAQIARMSVSATQNNLTLRLSVDALAETALPLPVPLATAGDQGGAWQPQSVLVDGKSGVLLRNDNGALLLSVGKGRHEVTISGDLGGHSQLQLPLTLKPRRVDVTADGWLVTGVDDEGVSGDAIQLLRRRAAGADATASTGAQAFAPLLVVTRTLHLGLSWDMDTRVERQGTQHTPAVAHVAVLPGEILTSEQPRVKDGMVEVGFAPGQTDVSWTSRLPITPSLTLQAAKTTDYVEVWRLDVSPLWHANIEGIAPVSQQEADYWLPSYQPWPGESLVLKITRPAGVQGQALTLDRADLTLTPGQRASDTQLLLVLRASQAGQQIVTLPEGNAVQSVLIDGRAEPVRQQERKLTLNLHPGSQSVHLNLRDTRDFPMLLRTPEIDAGLPGVNALIHVTLPPDRWVLLVGGPRMGPAVLFWGLLAVLVLIGAALGRVPLTPLKAHHWVLLMLGLSQLPVWGAALVAAWLLALGARGRMTPPLSHRRNNLMQAGLLLLSLLALELLFQAVAHGLLGAPDMQITGNDSYGYVMNWYQDRFPGLLPRAWILSVPLWVYRVLMLLWALWLANALLNWLRWGWAQYNAGGIWKKKPVVAAPATTGQP